MVLHWLHQFTRDVVGGKRPRAVETKIVSHSLGVQGVIDAVYECKGRLEVLDYKTGACEGLLAGDPVTASGLLLIVQGGVWQDS